MYAQFLSIYQNISDYSIEKEMFQKAKKVVYFAIYYN